MMINWYVVHSCGLGFVADGELQSNTAYTIMSGGSKLFALTSTYPYQVVRSRIQVRPRLFSVHCATKPPNSLHTCLSWQNNATAHLYPTIPACIKKTWAEEGLRGFYRGLGTNLVRVLPGTCVTFVVYENLAWLLRTSAVARERRNRLAASDVAEAS